jgi:hypothetical protein
MRAQPARSAPAARTLAGDELAIARSVLYASLFDYPLTLAQLRQTLIDSVQTPSQILSAYDRSDPLQAVVEYRDGFFFPRGRYGLVDERRRREGRSRAFLHRHRIVLWLVSRMPFVRMVALSGSIAHLNLEGDGDLDLFIVTRGRHVWSVAVAVVVLAKLMRQRRTVCANFVVADSRLTLEQQDLFTASQVVHLKPIVGRDLFVEFIAANPFVRRFYPNFHPGAAPAGLGPRAARRGGPDSRAERRFKSAAEWLLAIPAAGVEALCRRAYRAYLTRQAPSWSSPEQVRLENDLLKLHTRSHRHSVLARFEEAVKEKLELRS